MSPDEKLAEVLYQIFVWRFQRRTATYMHHLLLTNDEYLAQHHAELADAAPLPHSMREALINVCKEGLLNPTINPTNNRDDA